MDTFGHFLSSKSFNFELYVILFVKANFSDIEKSRKRIGDDEISIDARWRFVVPLLLILCRF